MRRRHRVRLRREDGLGQPAVDEIARGLATLRARYEGAELVHLGVEANVSATANELIERSPLIRKLVEGHLTILRAVYDLESGPIRWLNLDEARACGPPPVIGPLAGTKR